MAELPLVEATRKALAPHLVGRTIRQARILREDRVAHPGPADLVRIATGSEILGMERHGKLLGLRLDRGALWFHFMMNGNLRLVETDQPMLSHTHLVLELDDGRQLRHRDTRCLSHVWLLTPDEPDIWTGLADLGPDALSGTFTTEHLQGRLAATRRPVKTCLLDQHVVAGIGNIYADEALFEARISPLRPGKSLDAEEVGRLREAVVQVLAAECGRLARNPERFFGKPLRGRTRAGWKAYGRRGKPCVVCGTALEGAKIGGRATVYCPVCQK